MLVVVILKPHIVISIHVPKTLTVYQVLALTRYANHAQIMEMVLTVILIHVVKIVIVLQELV